MATTFYLHNIPVPTPTYGPYLANMRSSTGTNANLSTAGTPGGTTWVDTSPIGYFISRPLAPFTLSSSVNFSFYASKNQAAVSNATPAVRIYKLVGATGLSSQIVQVSGNADVTTTTTLITNAASPAYSSMSFDAGDRLVLQVGFTNIGGNMGANRILTFSFDSATTNSSITFTDNIQIKRIIHTS